MIAPGFRLILLTLALTPLGVVAAWGGIGLWIPALLYLMAVMAALWDLSSLLGAEHDVRVDVPSEIRQAKFQTGGFQVDVSGPEGGRPLRMDLGIPFAPELDPEREEVCLLLPGDGAAVRTEWAFRPITRGVYPVDALWVRRYSPLRFWARRSSLPVDMTFKVFPDLRRDRKVMAGLFLRHGLIGAHRQRKTGQGREYDQIREYQPGDSRMDIHWKASAKRNSPVTRTYQIERTQDVYLAMDHSRLSARLHPAGEGDPPEPILERYVNTANLLAMAAIRNGDLFGLMTFADHTDRFVKAGNGPRHLKTVQNSLFSLAPSNVYPDYDEWVRFTRMRVRRRSLIILLSDLSDATAFESLEKRVSLLARTHVLAVAMIPLPGVSPLFSGNAEEQDPYSRLAGHLMWKDLHTYRRRLRAMRVPLLLSSSEHLALDVVNQYLLIKQQQRL